MSSITASISPNDEKYATKPYIDGAKFLVDGKIEEFTGSIEDVTSPILDSSTGKRIVIGRMAQMGEEHALKASHAAKQAWNNGIGEWPQKSLQNRIESIQTLVAELKLNRDKIVNTLMWEICKNSADAAAEFDR